MALNKASLTAALTAVFADTSPGVTPAQKADQIATAIDDYVKQAIATVTVPPGTFLIAATAGVPNPLPVPLTGNPSLGTGGLT